MHTNPRLIVRALADLEQTPWRSSRPSSLLTPIGLPSSIAFLPFFPLISSSVATLPADSTYTSLLPPVRTACNNSGTWPRPLYSGDQPLHVVRRRRDRIGFWASARATFVPTCHVQDPYPPMALCVDFSMPLTRSTIAPEMISWTTSAQTSRTLNLLGRADPAVSSIDGPLES